MMRHLWVATLLLGVMLMAPLARAEMRLSLEDSRVLAIGLVQGGQPKAARAVALVLLQADPQDVTALIVLARSARALGRSDEAIAAGRQAFRLASSGDDRFSAALVTAQALSAADRKTRAQLWLRRAAEVAPDAQRRAVAVRDFAYVKSRNPLSAQLSFSTAPSSNINGGPTTTSVVIGGFEFFNPDAVPLSGLGVSLGGSLGYRIETGAQSHLRFGVSAKTTQYVLSDSARADVPEARASDYATAGVGASVTWSRVQADRRGRAQVTLAVGQDWSGGAVLARDISLSGQVDRAVNQTDRLGFHLTGTRTQRLDEDLRSSEKIETGLHWMRALPSGDGLVVRATLATTWSDAASIAHRAAGVGIEYQIGRPLAGMDVALILNLDARDYARPLYTVVAREDLGVEAGVMLTLRRVETYGFAPQLGVVASRTRSNVAMFDTERVEVRLSVKSVF